MINIGTSPLGHIVISEISGPKDVIIFTDGSVRRGVKSGWTFSARVSGNVIEKRSGAVDLTTSSIAMVVKAVTQALLFLKEQNHKKLSLSLTH